MTRTRHPHSHECSEAASRVAALEAELAALPALEDEAIAANDPVRLAQLGAQRRILTGQLATAATDLATAQQQAIADEVARVNTELLETVKQASEYDFAASVYRNLATEWRGREAMLNTQLLRLLDLSVGGAR